MTILIPIYGRSGIIAETLIDDEDISKVMQYRWRLSVKGYVTTLTPRRFTGKRSAVWLHRIVMDQPNGNGMEIDHRFGNKLDNRKSMLRVCIKQQNQRNRIGLNKNNKSGFRGVHWEKKANRWRAQIKTSATKPQDFLGYFDTAEQAYEAYEKAARLAFGTFFRSA